MQNDNNPALIQRHYLQTVMDYFSRESMPQSTYGGQEVEHEVEQESSTHREKLN